MKLSGVTTSLGLRPFFFSPSFLLVSTGTSLALLFFDDKPSGMLSEKVTFRLDDVDALVGVVSEVFETVFAFLVLVDGPLFSTFDAPFFFAPDGFVVDEDCDLSVSVSLSDLVRKRSLWLESLVILLNQWRLDTYHDILSFKDKKYLNEIRRQRDESTNEGQLYSRAKT